MTPAAISGDAACFVCDVAPSKVGTGFVILSRSRVLSWREVPGANGQRVFLPRTVFGAVPAAALVPSRRGVAVVEVVRDGTPRRWWAPWAGERLLDDAELRRLVARLDAIADALRRQQQRQAPAVGRPVIR